VIISRHAVVGIVLIVALFTATFTTLTGIARLPDELLSGEDIYIITRSDDPNPLRSEMSEGIAWAVENLSFVECVSPEIMVFTVLHGEPVVARGVYYDKFFRMEGGGLVRGRMPSGPGEGLIGINLERRVNIPLNGTVLLPSGFKSYIGAVRIVGVFRTGGMADDELLISVSLARSIAGMRTSTVAYVRVLSHDPERMSALLDPSHPKFYVKDLDYGTPGHVGEPMAIRVTVENFASAGGECRVRVVLGNITAERTVTLEGHGEAALNFTLVPIHLGNQTLRAEIVDDLFPHALTGYVEVVNRSLQIRAPMEVFAGVPFNVTVVNARGEPVEGCTVSVGDTVAVTDATGNAMFTLNTSGALTGYASAPGYENRSFALTCYAVLPLSEAVTLNATHVENLTAYGNSSSRLEIATDYDLLYSADGAYEEGLPLPRYINLSTLPEGETVFHVWGYMGYNYTEGNITVVVDNTPPWIRFPWANQRVRTGETIRGTVQEDVGLLFSRAVIYNGTYEETYEGEYLNIPTDNLRGNYTVLAEAEDLAGNVASFEFTVEVGEWNDSSPPYVAYYTGEVAPDGSFTAMLEDDFRVENYSVVLYLDGSAVRSVDGSGKRVSVSMSERTAGGIKYLPEGTYTASIRAVDPAGHVNTTDVTFTLNYSLDRTPPLIVPAATSVGVGEPLNITLWDANEIAVATVSGADYVRHSNSLTVTFNRPGTYLIEVVAADSLGNIAMANLTVSVFETGLLPEISWNADLHAPEYDNERWEVRVGAVNSGGVGGNLTLNITVDGEVVGNITVSVGGGESVYAVRDFDPLAAGRHVVEVTDGKKSVRWIVEVSEKYLERVPIDLLIKYGKDVELESRGGAVYKAIEISRGNFIVLISSVIMATAILMVLGVESIVSRCYEDRKRNLAVLRAIGATKADIRMIVLREFARYFLVSTTLGILLGLAIFLLITSTGTLRAFGHTVTFSVNLADLLVSALISLLISIAASYFSVQMPAVRKSVAQMVDRGARGREYIELEEVLNEA